MPRTRGPQGSKILRNSNESGPAPPNPWVGHTAFRGFAACHAVAASSDSLQLAAPEGDRASARIGSSWHGQCSSPVATCLFEGRPLRAAKSQGPEDSRCVALRIDLWARVSRARAKSDSGTLRRRRRRLLRRWRRKLRRTGSTCASQPGERVHCAATTTAGVALLISNGSSPPASSEDVGLRRYGHLGLGRVQRRLLCRAMLSPDPDGQAEAARAHPERRVPAL